MYTHTSYKMKWSIGLLLNIEYNLFLSQFKGIVTTLEIML